MLDQLAVASSGNDTAIGIQVGTQQCAVVCGRGGCTGACNQRPAGEDLSPGRTLESKSKNLQKKGGKMETISQGTSGPVAVVGNPGPAWSAFGASEAALSVLNYNGQGRTDNAVFSHFIRDSIERRADVSELRAEIRDLKAAQKPEDPTKVLVEALVAALKKA